MAILDILNRAESEFFSKVFKDEVDAFNRDFGLLFSEKVHAVQPSFDYLTRDKIVPTLQKKFLRIDAVLDGDINGNIVFIVKIPDAKVMCGLLMMMAAEQIKETLAQDFSADDKEVFKEIANQLNGSMDNSLRESFKFNFHATLKDVSLVQLDANPATLESVLPEAGYMVIGIVLKLVGFPDSSFYQYIPETMVKEFSKKQELDKLTGKEVEADETEKAMLVVDDDPVIRKIIRGFVKGLPITVHEAGDGVEAMQVLIRNKVHVIIMDIEMPNMNGLEACKRIKQNPNTKNIPVIMCSSKSTRENVLAAVNNGARDFLVKPINRKEIFHEKVLKFMKL